MTSDQVRELVRCATLAANSHNTQPWKFSVSEESMAISPDYTRRLPVVDPYDRALWISLGCATENLIVAAHSLGFMSEVTLPDNHESISVRWTATSPSENPLLHALELRQCTRCEYDGRTVEAEMLQALTSTKTEPGITVRFVSDRAVMEAVVELVEQGNLAQFGDRAFMAELLMWLRFNKREAEASGDGLYSACSGRPNCPRWLGKFIVLRTSPQKQADSDTRKLRSSAGAFIVASDDDSKAAWVRSGQVCERLALRMTAMGIRSAYLNQPIEVPQLRPQLQQALELGTHLPQLLVRFGYAEAMPQSRRRPIEHVMVQPQVQ